MPLPSLAVPEYTTKLPSSQQDVLIRPFLVKEEKLLLMASESGESQDMAVAVKQMLRNCILTDGINVETLPSFDVEWLFLKIRGHSLGTEIELHMHHSDYNEESEEGCKHAQVVMFDTDSAVINSSEGHEKVLHLTDEIAMEMKYPTTDIVDKINDSAADETLRIIGQCIDCVIENDNIYNDFTEEESNEFLDSLNTEQFEKITNFFTTAPTITCDISWVCEECKKAETLVVRGIEQLFTYA
jgi:hypothetical protein